MLLLSQEKAGRVNESPNTPPIIFMGKPLNVRGKTVTVDGRVSGACVFDARHLTHVKCRSPHEIELY